MRQVLPSNEKNPSMIYGTPALGYTPGANWTTVGGFASFQVMIAWSRLSFLSLRTSTVRPSAGTLTHLPAYFLVIRSFRLSMLSVESLAKSVTTIGMIVSGFGSSGLSGSALGRLG